MDDLAKLIARNQMLYNKTKFVTTTLGLGSVPCSSKLVVYNIRVFLYAIILQQKNITYLSDKFGIDDDTLAYETAWKSYGYGCAIKESSWGTPKFITKRLSGNTAT